MTQARLAETLGLSRASIANIELGRQKVFLHHVPQIASALGVELSELIPTLPEFGETKSPRHLLKSVPKETRPWVAAIIEDLIEPKKVQ